MTISVLAIDDSRTMRDLVRLTLEGEGMAVTLAEDGVAGVEAFQSGRFDAVITDINMPRMDGFEVIEALRRGARNRRVPILVLTTESGTELKRRARDSGAMAGSSSPSTACRSWACCAASRGASAMSRDSLRDTFFSECEDLKTAITALGGRIGIETTAGEGTTFSLIRHDRIPLAAESLGGLRAAAPVQARHRTHPRDVPRPPGLAGVAARPRACAAAPCGPAPLR